MDIVRANEYRGFVRDVAICGKLDWKLVLELSRQLVAANVQSETIVVFRSKLYIIIFANIFKILFLAFSSEISVSSFCLRLFTVQSIFFPSPLSKIIPHKNYTL